MKIVCLALLSCILLSCSEYNKVLKSDDYNRKFEYANNLYDGKKYARSIAIYEQVYQRFPKAGEGELSYYRIGKSYYQESDYYMAGYYLGTFTSRFPYSEKAEEALFLSAMCSVKNSPEASLDPNDTELAINDLQMFVDRYPNSNLIDSCNQWIDKLRFKLETKDFEAVKQYSKTQYFRAAVVSAQSFLKQYPLTRYKEEASYILVRNSYLLARNSVDNKKLERIEETIERYRNFVGEFPASPYKRELDTFRDGIDKELQKVQTGNLK
jgi:outer membrane protein assembly factor BamD